MKLLRPLVFAALAAFALPALAGGTVLDPAKLRLKSQSVLIIDPASNETIYAKSADDVTPIASITKLMTAMVVLDAHPDLDATITIDREDFDFLKGSRSRLGMGTELSRRELLQLALMSSENRAASALARSYPGGTDAFVAAMNAKALALGMTHTSFRDSTGLSPQNVSTANELAKMVNAAATYPMIREFTTTQSHFVEVQPTGRILGFNNSNRLVKSGSWDIKLQKTGFINEAGRCLVMMAEIASKPMVIVLLDSVGSYTRLADANRVKYWLETGGALAVAKAAPILHAKKTKHASKSTRATPVALRKSAR
ncbi:MAG: D-alanyl-D-alanine endopeptidase [Betaproteobacteria bacterium]